MNPCATQSYCICGVEFIEPSQNVNFACTNGGQPTFFAIGPALKCSMSYHVANCIKTETLLEFFAYIKASLRDPNTKVLLV